ncbi:EF-hand [Saitoella complicata NRRL Y-17804]|uniref:EF-hand domain-containing protein n=1 Tax=Saitoella complicata (strain BCRC 22490 / CBS 7301 / JCM 7358 / NBRC 10748 / NRRL Y-17804) TaxID=698492 RepID=A0A0E9NBL3_SAICN|nr:EF-hand [Saitoella complicata NRRL Y-17804]ODQ51518.1 EF-hand [Saitoella complicata NRRL Y-17804]GAO47267.1 hypothetical protein G7K_1477-t1 [Saitoella complicata NRRL Y-17804]
MADQQQYRDAFALFDKHGNGHIEPSRLPDLLRACGQNPTQAECDDVVESVKGEVDYPTFLEILNRPDGFRPIGEASDFVRGFQVFDKEGTGMIGVGELRYVLTQLGDKLTDEEVDELLKGVAVRDGNVDYTEFVKMVLSS